MKPKKILFKKLLLKYYFKFSFSCGEICYTALEHHKNFSFLSSLPPQIKHFLLCIKPKIPKKTHKPFFNNSKP